MKEVFESIFISFKERFQNRFIGTFVVTFLILNWERELALFYLKDMKYAEAVSTLSMADGYLYCLIARAALYSIIYLAASPWLSYGIQLVQSIPINKYKRKNISDDMDVIMEKEKLEKKKRDVMELAHKNLVAESVRSDEIVFERMKSSYNETELVWLLNKVKNGEVIQGEKIDRIKNYLIDCEIIDNKFSSEPLMRKQRDVVNRINVLLEYIAKNYSLYDSRNYKLDHDLDSELAKEIADSVLASYRDFRDHKLI